MDSVVADSYCYISSFIFVACAMQVMPLRFHPSSAMALAGKILDCFSWLEIGIFVISGKC